MLPSLSEQAELPLQDLMPIVFRFPSQAFVPMQESSPMLPELTEHDEDELQHPLPILFRLESHALEPLHDPGSMKPMLLVQAEELPHELF